MLIAAAHAVGGNMAMATTRDEYYQLCAEAAPSIVHIHVSLPFPLPRDTRLVFTPHGQTPRPANYYVVIARSVMERQRLLATFPRVETILNPLITRTITPQACAQQHIDIYSRVADSDVRTLMTPETRHVLAAAIAAAIGGDRRWAPASVDSELPHANLRHISLYAQGEGVLPLVEQGLQLLGAHTPQQAAAHPYLPAAYTVPQPLLSDISPRTFANILDDIRLNGPSLLRLAELSQVLHSNSFNPATFTAPLASTPLQRLLASLLPLIATETLLGEGFMPCEPATDAEAAKLRQQFEERQRVG